jgi:hypothetical protein
MKNLRIVLSNLPRIRSPLHVQILPLLFTNYFCGNLGAVHPFKQQHVRLLFWPRRENNNDFVGDTQENEF